MIGDYDVFRNRIVNSENGSALIARYLPDISYSITCYYERIHRLEYGYSVLGTPHIRKTLLNAGDYNVSFDFSMYTDDTFWRKVSAGANTVSLNERTYFAVNILPPTSRVAFESCWTTPTNDSNDSRRYNLIDGYAIIRSATRVGLSSLKCKSH